MKSNRMRYLLLFAFGFFQFSLVAQVQVESGLTIEDYVNNVLLGNGVQASAPGMYTCKILKDDEVLLTTPVLKR